MPTPPDRYPAAGPQLDKYIPAGPLGRVFGGRVKPRRRSTLNASSPTEGGFVMRHHWLPIGVFAITFGLLAARTPALAAAETWVSGTGTDTGTCPITAP